MQTQQPSCANHTPRITPTRPDLFRRLHRWLAVRRTQSQVNRISAARANLQHWMAMDQACILAHRLQYTKSLVLQQRVRDDQAKLAQLNDQLALLRGVLAEVEGAL